MSNFYDEVIEILKDDERFFSQDGSLLKNALYEAAMRMDSKLIKLLFLILKKTFKKFYYLIIIKYLFFIRTKRQAKINREEISPFIFNTLHYLII